MRVLITGITGFAGSHLAEYCLAQGSVEVVGLARRRERLGHAAPLVPHLQMVEADLRDAGGVERAIRDSRPDVIFHLGGQAFVPLAFEDPAGTLLDNAVGQLHVILALLRCRPDARLLVVGSGTEYGVVRPEQNPIGEDAPLQPVDPYAVSKVAQDLLGYQYFMSHRLQAVRVRPFNHTGPRQSAAFVASGFARQIAEIEAGRAPPHLSVGNLSAVRDFTDVRDMVRAYYLAGARGEPGEVYNLGSGLGRKIEEVLRILAGFSKSPLTIEEDPARIRPPESPVLISNPARFRARTGWEAQLPLERTLADTLEYWRAQLAR
jgi:GDP-4-dehydro-6-deoxy-D-mannose reductase